MTKRKKITRKQLLKEPDEFITTTGKMIRAMQAYRAQLTYAAGGVLIILLAVAGLRYYSEIRENRAFTMLEQVLIKYEARKNDVGIQQAYNESGDDFEGILKAYSGNNGGKMARLVFADICYDAGDLDRAVELYTGSLDDFDENTFLKKLIISSLGHAYHGKNELKAAETFYQTNAGDSEPFLKDEALFHLGKIYDAMGDRHKSQIAFKEILSDFPASIYVNMVNEKVSG